MPKLLQIDSCRGVLSTGKITEQIGKLARENGWETYLAHGARFVGPSEMISYQMTSKLGEYMHYAKSMFFDMHGLGSNNQTRSLVRWIDNIRPDIVHLHCIHGYYLNYKILFEYLNSINIPIVWTFHDCWAFTGHCAYFEISGCNKWQDSCHNCKFLSEYPKALISHSKSNYLTKRELFSSNKNLHIVAVSNWMKLLVEKSFLSSKNITVIKNGIDLSKFSPRAHNSSSKLILGVASSWDERKGLLDFIKLNEILGEQYEICLVGLNDDQIKKIPNTIHGLKRTDSSKELADLYSRAMVFVNPTYADTYPTVNLEALACGTPVVTYDTGGSPESIDKNTGIVVPRGDVYGLANAIRQIQEQIVSPEACRRRAEEYFDKNLCFMKYLDLYNELLNNK